MRFQGLYRMMQGMMQAIPTSTPGVSNFGLIKVRNNDALAAEEQSRVRPPEPPAIVSSLSGHVSKCWQNAKMAKQPIEQQMMRSLRQRYGIYEADRMAAIREMGGSEIYVLLTLTKCRAAEAWIHDTLSPAQERPWAIEPTPVTELPPDIEAGIRQQTEATFRSVVDQINALAGMVDVNALRAEIQEYMQGLGDKAMRELQEEAERRMDRMAAKIEDQLTEGGWHEAFQEFVFDVVTLKGGVLKGPVVRRKKVQKWIQGPQFWTPGTSDELVLEFDRVSPFDIYPQPGSRGVDDGYIIERHMLTRSDLVAMLGVPGYSDEAIRAALSDYEHGKITEFLPIDSERYYMEHGETTTIYQTGKIEALEFWGSVQGRLLIEWGMSDGIDPQLEYEVNVWQVGTHVIRAILNPDKLGRKPYSVTSFEKIPGCFWGMGIPEMMEDCQDACNAVARAIVNNTGIASGPLVEMNMERCDDNTKLWPWRVFQSTNQQMSEAPAVRFFQPTIVTGPLMEVYEYFSRQADDQTGVPRWSHGNTNVGGVGETSSGLSMMMTYAARGIKKVIANIDTVISGVIGRTYDYNMIYDRDQSLKGDAKVVARGASALVAREQKMLRINEFLATTNNPVDYQLMGPKFRAKLLRNAAKNLEIPDYDEIGEDLPEILQQLKQQAAQVGWQGRTPDEKPQKTDPAGNPAGGTDFNAFQNRPGVRT